MGIRLKIILVLLFPQAVNLWKIYKAVEKLGGYDSVSTSALSFDWQRLLVQSGKLSSRSGVVTWWFLPHRRTFRLLSNVSPPLQHRPLMSYCGTYSERASHTETASEQVRGFETELTLTTATSVSQWVNTIL